MTSTAASRPAFRFHPLLWAAALVLLALPAAGMVLTDEVDWGAEDFAAFGVMLALLCLSFEAAWHWLAAPRWRVTATLLAGLVFLTVWAHLAVDLFD